MNDIQHLTKLPLGSLVNAQTVKTIWEEANMYEAEKNLGAVLFPNKATYLDDIKTLMGKKEMPRMLEISAYDTKPSIRDRIGFEEIQFNMPFFREGRRIGEKEAVDLHRLITAGRKDYIPAVLDNIYNDLIQLIQGGEKRAEHMRMQVLVNGRIRGVNREENGRSGFIDFDYDYDGSWRKNNNIVLTGTDQWTAENKATATPLQDLVDLLDKIAGETGKRPNKLIMNTKTFNDMLEADEIRKLFSITLGDRLVLSHADKKAKFSAETGITPIIYDKLYVDDFGNQRKYIEDGVCVLIPDGALGNTYFGENPEDYIYGGLPNNSTIAKVGAGFTVTTTTENMPPSIMGTVSATMLPSFDRMKEVYVIKQEYATKNDDPYDAPAVEEGLSD